jgi:NAD(P)-dependent dehydrogenase (short-subunit alcohol dehydrogenase family)
LGGGAGAEGARKFPGLEAAGRPEDVAAAVVWLCSDAASFVNGHAMLADGALTA